MGRPGDRDLATLTLDACRARLGEEFVRPDPGGRDVVLVLAEADRMKRDPRAPTRGDRPFRLVFRGPRDPRLTQGMHDLDHPESGLPGIFLVPVDEDGEGILYEAVFG
jgi:hypothetical protein